MLSFSPYKENKLFITLEARKGFNERHIFFMQSQRMYVYWFCQLFILGICFIVCFLDFVERKDPHLCVLSTIYSGELLFVGFFGFWSDLKNF